MKINKTVFFPVILFAVMAILITYFFPREGKFTYQFYEGKPWQYDLLTAPFDFPIYKTDSELKAEKDSLRARFRPYYRMDMEIKTRQLERLASIYPAPSEMPVQQANCLRYITSQLNRMYDKGIVSPKELDALKHDKHVRVNLIRDNVSETRSLIELHTTRSAYEALMRNAPASLDRNVLRALNVDMYLCENVDYDAETSSKVLNDELQNVSVSSGMVQAGERLTDRGEVIDGRTYRILSSLKKVSAVRTGGSQRYAVSWFGQFILIFGIMLCSGLYLASFCPNIFHSRRNLLFVALSILTTCILAELCAGYEAISIYILPFAVVPVVVRTFFDSHTALFTHLITILLCSLIAPFPHEFLILQIIAGITVIFTLKELTQRSQLVRCAIYLFAAYTLSYLSLALYQEGDPGKIRWIMLLYFGINLTLLMFSYLLIYLLEKIFGYVSPITLVELSNINAPILNKLSETCPGTFQHVLQVSILASEAGAKTGANTQLIRTGALYHDIGKMHNPLYFTENQKDGNNPHEELTYEESARIIIRHVTDGVKMAEKAALPKQIIDFIRTHHGEGKTKYFYNSYLNAFPDRPIDEKLFTYPGPNPFSKETGILMMADAVEASSRSLHEYTAESITALVNKIVDSQIDDGLLKNTPLTFKDIEDVKTVFIEKLKTMHHTRVSYPDVKQDRTITAMKY